MSTRQSLQLTGLRETLAQLSTLGKGVQRSVIRKGLTAGARVIVPVEKGEAPRRQRDRRDKGVAGKGGGLLKKSIGVIPGKRKGKLVRVFVAPRSAAFKTIYPPVYYPAFVAHGHRKRTPKGVRGAARRFARALGGGGSVPPNDFVGRAFAAAAAAATARIVSTIEKEFQDR